MEFSKRAKLDVEGHGRASDASMNDAEATSTCPTANESHAGFELPSHLDLYCDVEPCDYRAERCDFFTVQDMCERVFFSEADIASKIDTTLEAHKEAFHALLERKPQEFSDDTKSYSVTLPLADHSSLSNRLRFNICDEKNQTAFVITEFMATAYQCLIQWVDGHVLSGRKHSNLFIGTSGIGKSAAMYVTSFGLRASRSDGIRVTFISADTWMCPDPVMEILVALIRTFYSDVEIPLSDVLSGSPHPPDRNQMPDADADAVHNGGLFTWCMYVMNNYHNRDSESRASATKRLMEFIDHLITAVNTNELRWIFIVDQLNTFYSANKQDNTPFTIVTELHNRFKASKTRNAFLVLACSQTNDELRGFPRETLDILMIDTCCSTVLTKSQIVCLLKLLNYEKKFEYSLDLVADSILQCGSGTPLEVSMYCTLAKTTTLANSTSRSMLKRYGCNPEQDIAHYVLEAGRDVASKINEFVAKKWNNNMKSYRQVLGDVIAEAPYTQALYELNMDKRLVRYIGRGTESGHVQAINQTVLRVLRDVVPKIKR